MRASAATKQDTDTTDWSKPQLIDDVTKAFPANVIGKLMPRAPELPEEYGPNGHGPFVGFVDDWFGGGIGQPRYHALKTKPGIDKDTAFEHLKACMGSYEPSHEHKIGAVAFLMSKWFEPETP